jgi:hypothetical protein
MLAKQMTLPAMIVDVFASFKDHSAIKGTALQATSMTLPTTRTTLPATGMNLLSTGTTLRATGTILPGTGI